VVDDTAAGLARDRRLPIPPTRARTGGDLVSVDYHETTKHHFGRFARSRGYLDWATQPDPFRRYHGAPLVPLSQEEYVVLPLGTGVDRVAAAPVTGRSVSWFLRYSMGLSAWKAYRGTRWALRVNPSSGNLHPTEAYIVHDERVFHYAPREHALEERAVLPPAALRTFLGDREAFLVALTSIQWREAWKYGERAFRYCQHDVGHAIAALRVSASLFGWTLRLLPDWSDEEVAGLLGVDRDVDRAGAEPEHPECLALVAPSVTWRTGDPDRLVAACRGATWQGRANILSPGHDDWPIIGEVSEATKYPGPLPTSSAQHLLANRQRSVSASDHSGVGRLGDWEWPPAIILQRRSAVAFDARSSLPRRRFIAMLQRLNPAAAPFDAVDWPAHVHLALFVHRVDGLVPGVYAYLRDAAVCDEWRSVMRQEFLWEHVGDDLFLLLPTDVMWAANRVSCDQEIAADGFFSLGMIARVESALRRRGEWFYRRLFWECGMIGQVLYLEAEAAGARGTGIGCFYDDAVHELLGLGGREWQSLYHFAMGAPVDDPRLTTERGYGWDASANSNQDVPAHDGPRGDV
jgi:SagB-type dehydrogenase family enzyme